MNGPRIGSLCSGYGGLDSAVQEVFGGSIAWFFEYDKAPSKILAHHWPEVPNYGDMTTADWAGIEQVDILCGGTPCQDLSGAGKRAGMTEGTRSNLWVQMREAIAIQRPSVVVWENVRGAYSARADSEVEREEGLLGAPSRTYLRALGRVLGDLSSLGYDAGWIGLRAADAGAPHGRYRVFVLAYARRDEPERWGINRDLGSAPTSGEGEGHKRERVRYAALDRDPKIGPLPDTSSQRGDESDHVAGLSREGADGASVAHERGSRPGVTEWGDYHPAIERWERVLGRRAPAPTNGDGRDGSHRLSSRFVEFMMGLPEGHVTSVGLTRNEELKALGNGVVPQQATLALRHLLARMEVVT